MVVLMLRTKALALLLGLERHGLIGALGNSLCTTPAATQLSGNHFSGELPRNSVAPVTQTRASCERLLLSAPSGCLPVRGRLPAPAPVVGCLSLSNLCTGA